MARRFLMAALAAAAVFSAALSHDLFIKADSFFFKPNTKATVRLLNGTFLKSEGIVARPRMRDARIVSPSGTVRPADEWWRDEGEMTLLDFQTGEEGTYVVAVSTSPREIDLKAADFNDYLRHDGIPDVLAARAQNKELGKDIRERYSKHVKAIIQVGEQRTEHYQTVLGYPAEIIPGTNPYSLRPGRVIEVLCTVDGKPVANQYVLAAREARGRLSREAGARTNRDGIARFRIHSAGRWYIKFIHMEPSSEPGINYESKWATLTFEIRRTSRGR